MLCFYRFFISISSFLLPETADIFSFLEFMEEREQVDSMELLDKSAMLRSRWQNKRLKLKAMYKNKFHVCMKKEKRKYKSKLSRLERTHEKSVRLKYLMESPDVSFTMEEWRRDHES